MLVEKVTIPAATSPDELFLVRRANWVLASAAVKELGDDWDLINPPFLFLCECGRPGCSSTVEMPILAYVEATSRRHLIISAGHQSPLDSVEDRVDGYVVVRRNEGF
jgi:hypothetical protein